ncbi:hypothetical protein [Desulfospira joergensenii]|uniref:hypothetical protein n=1 Tax=Desulfospira joergensenii TaxID=53329 RepID=UPI0003B6D376|nr:hypothetical protein [Desulfospira joergensenii]
MQTSIFSGQTYRNSIFTLQDQVSTQRANSIGDAQQTEVIVETKSVKITSGYDLTNMTSGDMLGLAKSFYEEGNTQDFLSLTVFSARAALEDHPDAYVTKTWTTPRNKNGTFNLLAEIQATPKYATGSPELDAENKVDREHLLNTLLSLPVQTTIIEQSSINITV